MSRALQRLAAAGGQLDKFGQCSGGSRRRHLTHNVVEMGEAPMVEMTPDGFFEGLVLEDYEDWKNDPHSIRKSFHSAVSAFHLADHYFNYYHRHNQKFSTKYKKLENYQTALKRRTTSFKVIQDMANAYKHLYTRGSCSILSGGAIENVTYGKQIIENAYSDNNGHEQIDGIIIRRRDGSVVQFTAAIADVIEMWRKIMYEGNQPAL
jgi:hypothetical protein